MRLNILNKMKPTFLFALLLFYGISMGQNSIPKKNIKQYNHWINLAELAVCDQNFENASIYYDEAFKYHRPYAQDVFSPLESTTNILETRHVYWNVFII